MDMEYHNKRKTPRRSEDVASQAKLEFLIKSVKIALRQQNTEHMKEALSFALDNVENKETVGGIK